MTEHEEGGMSDELYEATGQYVRVWTEQSQARTPPDQPDPLLAQMIADSGWWEETKRRMALYASGGGDPEWRSRVAARLAQEG